MTISQLISALQAHVDAGLPPGAVVYVREETRLNGAGWTSPRYVRPGFDPHPLSAANDGTLVVFVS